MRRASHSRPVPSANTATLPTNELGSAGGRLVVAGRDEGSDFTSAGMSTVSW